MAGRRLAALGRHISYMIYARRAFCRNAVILTALAHINMPVDFAQVVAL